MAPLNQRPAADDDTQDPAVLECLQELAETVEGSTSSIYLPPFRIVYRRDEDAVTIVRVLRSERLMDPGLA